MTAAVRSSPEFARLEGMISQASSEGKLVYRGEMDKTSRRMGIHVVLLNEAGKAEKGALVEDEIFGLVLPIIPVEVGHPSPSGLGRLPIVGSNPWLVKLLECRRGHRLCQCSTPSAGTLRLLGEEIGVRER